MNVSHRLGPFALVLAVLTGLTAAPALGGHDRDKKRKTDRDVFYTVVQLRDVTGDISFEVIRSDDYRKRKKELHEQFTVAAKSWLAERARCRRSGEDFDEPKPRKPAIRKIGDLHKSREEAEAFLTKVEAVWEKKMAEKRRREMEEAGKHDDRAGEENEKRFDHREAWQKKHAEREKAREEKKHAHKEKDRAEKQHGDKEKKHAEKDKDKDKKFDF
jgi:hypothetical protein